MNETQNVSGRPRRISILVGGFLAGILILLAWHRGWFSGEPIYQGRTVTQCLDGLRIYEYKKVAGDVHIVLRSAEEIRNDPAFEALLSIGGKGVPVLVQRVKDRAELSSEVTPLKRWRIRLQWQIKRMLGAQGVELSLVTWSERQRARKTAAAFALVTMGTKEGGGFSTFMEAYGSAPKHQSVYGSTVAGPPVGLISSMIADTVVRLAPDRREEILGEVMEGLRHTNAWCRVVSLEWARMFPEELLRNHKEQLVKLTRDQDPLVQEAVLGTLMNIVQQDSLTALISRAEVAAIVRTIPDQPSSSERITKLALEVLMLATNKQPATVQSP